MLEVLYRVHLNPKELLKNQHFFLCTEVYLRAYALSTSYVLLTPSGKLWECSFILLCRQNQFSRTNWPVIDEMCPLMLYIHVKSNMVCPKTVIVFCIVCRTNLLLQHMHYYWYTLWFLRFEFSLESLLSHVSFPIVPVRHTCPHSVYSNLSVFYLCCSSC